MQSLTMDKQLSLNSLELGESPSRSGGSVGATSTSPHSQLVHRSAGTAIYRQYHIGFKVLLDPDAASERLLNEHTVSNFLPPSCRKRQVIDVTSFDRQPALRFDWASGVTLREWLRNARSGSQVDLSVRLKAAMAIAKTLSDFHGGGVVYNRLAPENVVLEPFEGEYAATFIDLSGARIYRKDNTVECDPVVQKQATEGDLRHLGLVLYYIFQGEERALDEDTTPGHIDPEDVPYRDRRKRGKPLAVAEGLPLYLGTLIAALVETSTPSAACYESAKEVFLDLKTMAQDAHGGCHKIKLDASALKSRLRVEGGAFYGRKVELSMLLHLFQTGVVLGTRPLMAIVSGSPGTGYVTLTKGTTKGDRVVASTGE